MIEKLRNKDVNISSKIRSVFQVSYAIEAKMLNATDFPPLKRPLESYIESKNAFYGFLLNKEIAGIIEIKSTDQFIHIQSLVVHPDYFRQGVARKLMEYVLESYDSNLFVVETGVDNVPASALYRKLDFIEVKQWDTDHGVRKIKFEKIVN